MVKFVKYEFNLSKEQRGRKSGDFGVRMKLIVR